MPYHRQDAGLIGFEVSPPRSRASRSAADAGDRLNRSPKKYPKVEFVEFDELLTESDVISIHLLLNDETRAPSRAPASRP
jgi:D-3-phosphoglycerate dehydrogenase